MKIDTGNFILGFIAVTLGITVVVFFGTIALFKWSGM